MFFLLQAKQSNFGYLSGLSERGYMKKLSKLIEPNSTIFNIGANTGYLALWLSQDFHKRDCSISVVAFEPIPENFSWLNSNVELNSWCSIHTEKLALGDKNETVTFYSSGRGDGSASVDASWGGEKQYQHQISMITLDRYCTENPNVVPNWLTLDVEGFGGNVIAGAKNTIDRYRPFITAEIHSDRELTAMESVLNPLGYKRSYDFSSKWGTHYVWSNQANT